jgi:predicted site-specific integrase-resolvase
MRTWSTAETAKLLGISWDTLHRWMREKRVPTPPAKALGRLKVRLWTKKDIEKVREYMLKHYWGLGSKKPRKKKTK